MNTLYKAALPLYLLLNVCWQGYAQTEKLRFEHININNGLSQNDVLSIKQDSKGYIWIGTLDGLNKYDGYQFTTYQRKPYDTTSLTMNAITGIWEGGNGSIWVHPVNSDINLFNPTTETFSVINLLPAKNVRFDVRLLGSLIEDKEGMIWVNNEKGQLCRFDKKNNQLSDEAFATEILNNPYNKRSKNKSVQSLFKDKKGTLWIGSSEGLHQVQYISNKNIHPSRINFIHYWYNPKDTSSCLPVNKIFEDHTGKLWLGTPQGLACFDPHNKTKVPILV